MKKKTIILALLMLTSISQIRAVDYNSYPQSDFQSVNTYRGSNSYQTNASNLSSTISTEATIQSYYSEASMPTGPAKLPGAGGTPRPPMPDTPNPEDRVTPIGEIPFALIAILAAAWAFRKKEETACE